MPAVWKKYWKKNFHLRLAMHGNIKVSAAGAIATAKPVT
jgi:hypothetical protein